MKKKVLIYATILLLIVACARDENNNWYKNAKEKVRLNRIMSDQSKTGVNLIYLFNLHLFNRTAKKLEESLPPNEKDLEGLLQSTSIQDKEIALVTIAAKKIYSDNLYMKILDLLKNEKDVLLRNYAYWCFSALDKKAMDKYKDGITEILADERNEIHNEPISYILVNLDSQQSWQVPSPGHPPGTVACGNGSWCSAGEKCMVGGGCMPEGAMDCGNGGWCPTDQKCIVGHGCMPKDAVECGNGEYCHAGQRCGLGHKCLNEGNTDCGNGSSCRAGYKCMIGGGCMPEDAVDCGNGEYCHAGERCESGHKCLVEGDTDCGYGRSCS